MTARQIRLLRGEVQRHVALAMVSREPSIHSDHMEVAAALSAAIQESEEVKCQKKTILRRLWRWAIHLGSGHRDSPVKALAGRGAGR